MLVEKLFLNINIELCFWYSLTSKSIISYIAMDASRAFHNSLRFTYLENSISSAALRACAPKRNVSKLTTYLFLYTNISARHVNKNSTTTPLHTQGEISKPTTSSTFLHEHQRKTLSQIHLSIPLEKRASLQLPIIRVCGQLSARRWLPTQGRLSYSTWPVISRDQLNII